MENFDWTRFTLKVAIQVPLSAIYDAWTKSSELEKWFLKEAKNFDTKHQLISKEAPVAKDYNYEWSWFLYDGIEKGKITEANGQDFLQFTFADECLVDIQLNAQDDFVVVTLTQKNIPTDDKSKKDIRLGCDSGWSFFLVNLKSVYEHGNDLRNKNANFKGMVNS